MADDARNSGLAGRYATAIFDLASETSALDAVAADFASLKSMIAASPDLARLVKAPVFSSESQAKGMQALLTQMRAAPLTTKFILLLATKRRLFVLTDIIAAFDAMLARARNEVRAEVTSARPLRDAEVAELKRVLQARLQREPLIETHVDPSLLGGLLVRVGSRLIDSSLRTKLDAMRIAMRGHVN